MSKPQLKEDKLIRINFSTMLMTPEKARHILAYLYEVESNIKAKLCEDYLDKEPVLHYESFFREDMIPIACVVDKLEDTLSLFRVEVDEISKYVQVQGTHPYSQYEEILGVWESHKQEKSEVQ